MTDKNTNSTFCKFRGTCPSLCLEGLLRERLQPRHRELQQENAQLQAPKPERNANFFETQFEIQNSNPCAVPVKPGVLLIAGIPRAQFDPKELCREGLLKEAQASRKQLDRQTVFDTQLPHSDLWEAHSRKACKTLGTRTATAAVGWGRFCDFPYLNNFPTNGLEKITCLGNEWVITAKLCSSCKTNDRNKEWGEEWVTTKLQMMKMPLKK